jgi:hypothetical protein
VRTVESDALLRGHVDRALRRRRGHAYIYLQGQGRMWEASVIDGAVFIVDDLSTSLSCGSKISVKYIRLSQLIHPIIWNDFILL